MIDTTIPILGRIGRMLTLGSMKRFKSPYSLSVKMSATTESIYCSILSVLFPRSKSLVWQGRDNCRFHRWVPAASCKCCRRAANNHHDHHFQHHHHHHHVFFKCDFYCQPHHVTITTTTALEDAIFCIFRTKLIPHAQQGNPPSNEDKLSWKVSWFS